MRIVSLTLQGFKSFGDRASIEFADGVTAIVGPNGSGKSNIIDALRWTTGGGRASSFRAEDKTDLIFHGASGKRSVGLAEVEIELRDGDRSLKIARTLDREGTTRLRLNGRAARFLDVEEALAGSGLGRAGLAVIGQGEVSQVLMADPARLLEYVSEAAGAARLSTRRDQAQDRLDTASSHLERLQLLLHDLEQRCDALSAEASDAKRHAELTAESLRLRFTVASARQESLLQDIAQLTESRAELEAQLAEGRGAMAHQRSLLEAARSAHERSQDQLRQAAADLEAKRGEFRLAEERLSGLRARRASLQQQADNNAAEVTRLEATTAPSQPDRSVSDAELRVTELGAALRAAVASLASSRSDLQAAAADLEAKRQRSIEHERAMAAYESRVTALQEQQRTLEERLTRSAEASETEDPALLEAKYERAREARAKAAVTLELRRQELAEVHSRQALAAAEAMASKRAAERLRAAHEARRGYTQGPRAALSSGIDGVIGSVADLLRVDPEYQQAIAAALGRRAEYVVVDTAETAERVLAHVKRSGGYVTVLPLDLLRRSGGRADQNLLGRPGVVAPAADLVSADDRYELLVDMLLGNTLVLETMRAAYTIARGAGHRPRMATLDGEILESSGAMSGGRRSQQGTVLGAAAELEDAEAAADQAAKAAANALDELEAAQQVVREAQELLKELSEGADELGERLARAREARAVGERLLVELRERLADVTAELAGLTPPAEQRDDEAELDLPAAAERHRAATEAHERRQREEAELRAAEAGARHDLELLQERWAAYSAGTRRFEEAKTRLGELAREAEALAEAAATVEREQELAAERLEAARAELPAGLEKEEQAVIAARAVVVEREGDLTSLGDKQATIAQAIEDGKVQLARKETALELAEEELRSFPPGVPRLDLSERAARSRLREVSDALEGLGAVNHRAAGELQEVSERKETLEVEAVQATLAVAELQTALERIDRQTNERLNAALERLQSTFGRHVQHLFGPDARGSIEVDVEGNRPVGVRIRLQPPGKQTQSLHLLSVGERTMGALAFLFALMAGETAGQGLPVAILDEVDAPLDEANIRRFATFLARLAKHGTQFVLITHQKATFEVADTLWGITTERGVSRVFSVRRSEAEELERSRLEDAGPEVSARSEPAVVAAD